MKLTDRQQHVLAAFSAGESSHELSPVQAQKIFFLIDREAAKDTNGPYFNFKPYDYGPFDRQVYDEMTALSLFGYVATTQTNRHRIYALTDAGKVVAKVLFENLNPSAKAYMAAAKDWVKEQDFGSLVSAIYKAYPDMKENSVFGN